MITTQILKDQYRNSGNLDARIRLHRMFSTNDYGWFRWYLDLLEMPEHPHILELGCGPAALWQNNTTRLPDAAQLVLTDFSPGMIRQARQNTPDHRFRFAIAAAQSIPFPSASFDLVLANHMLYHVPDRDQAIAEIRRVLKPGGRLYAATNGERHMKEMDELVARLIPELSPHFLGRSFAAPFTLENGEAQLAPYFHQLRLERYPDTLVITQARPLIDYILSMSVEASRALSAQALERLTQQLDAEIQDRGPIHITKDSGTWIACE